jgi:leucyl-tRNA synthetase
MIQEYIPNIVEQKWQQHWQEKNLFQVKSHGERPKFYCLDMFPYPSGAGLHVGHPLGYTATDIFSRYKRMNGFDVLHPMGFDAFGLPAEQHALATGEHPSIVTRKSCERFVTQLKLLGFSYSWDRLLATTDEEYYHWTQWIFIQLYNSWYDQQLEKARPISELVVPDAVVKEGAVAVARFYDEHRLAYYGEALVNWCPALGTVLANEEVIDGRSERGNHEVVRRPMKQWFLRITKYGDRLVDELVDVDWPESIKEQQRNWVGKKEGALVHFATPDRVHEITAFTTRVDTLFGVTFVVLAPEHHLVDVLTSPSQRVSVEAYKENTSRLSDIERTVDEKSKTGVPLGTSVINPASGELIPLWIGDYVLASYGTGAVMGVPAHDERDFVFAKKYGLSIRRVIVPAGGKEAIGGNEAFVDDGVLLSSTCVNSHEESLQGSTSEEARRRITEFLAKEKRGEGTVQYKLRDWLFSRQRYWGEPIPIIHWEDGTTSSVSEADLPLRLPEVSEYRQVETGESPLARANEWLSVQDPVTGRRGRRETNTMPQWAGSCWYYLRFTDPKNLSKPWSPSIEARWMPVDLYVGGAEHAVLHLLYARFWHKVLFDLGHVSTREPFQKLFNQGFIISEAFKDSRGALIPVDQVHKGDDGTYVLTASGERVERIMAKMSKSLKNVVDPIEVVNRYGADTLRMFLMFMGPLDAMKVWDDKAIAGVHRFLKRAWTLIHRCSESPVLVESNEEKRVLARAIKQVTQDIEGFRFNTAIAALMECCNSMLQHGLSRQGACSFTLLLSPFAPHMAEELWAALGNPDSLAFEAWPSFEEKYLQQSSIEIVIQVGGKKRGSFTAAPEITDEVIYGRVHEVLSDTPYALSTSDALRIVRSGEGKVPKLVNVIKA